MVWPTDGVATSQRHTVVSAHTRGEPHHSHQHAASAHATLVPEVYYPAPTEGGSTLPEAHL